MWMELCQLRTVLDFFWITRGEHKSNTETQSFKFEFDTPIFLQKYIIQKQYFYKKFKALFKTFLKRLTLWFRSCPWISSMSRCGGQRRVWWYLQRGFCVRTWSMSAQHFLIYRRYRIHGFLHLEIISVDGLRLSYGTKISRALSIARSHTHTINSMVMGAAQYVIYAINTGKLGYSPRIKNQTFAYAVSVVGFISCVLLSWVAAICDNDNAESCRGDGTIHSICAVSFFIGYNFMMAMSSFSKHNDGVSTLVRLSILSKLRFIHPVSGLLTSTPVRGIKRLLQLSSGQMLVWFWYGPFHLITNSPKVRVGICKIDSDETQSMTTMKAAYSWTILRRRKTSSNDQYYNVFLHAFLNDCSIVVLVLFVSLAFMLHQGRIPSGHVLQSGHVGISSGDWISRNMVMGGSVCAILVHICFYYAGTISNDAPSGCLKPSVTQTCLCILSLLGLSVVGCVNEDENPTVHVIAAGTFFACYDVYMFWTFLMYFQVKGYNVLYFILTLCSVLTKVRFMSSVSLGDNTPEILEWLDALVLIAFFWSDNYYHSSVSDLIGVLIYRDETPPVLVWGVSVCVCVCKYVCACVWWDLFYVISLIMSNFLSNTGVTCKCTMGWKERRPRGFSKNQENESHFHSKNLKIE